MQKLNEIFDRLLSLILPKEESVEKIEKMDDVETSELPKANETSDTKFKAVFLYKDKTVRRAIWEIKYRKNMNILRKFTKALYELMLEELGDETLFENFRNPLLVPIPASKSGLKERGFNQCELIVCELCKLDRDINFKLELNALKKIKETPHQSKLKNRAERLRNLKDCFSANSEKIKGRCVIVVDDVITTGTTMSEASKALHKAGAKKVIGFSIAH